MRIAKELKTLLPKTSKHTTRDRKHPFPFIPYTCYTECLLYIHRSTGAAYAQKQHWQIFLSLCRILFHFSYFWTASSIAWRINIHHRQQHKGTSHQRRHQNQFIKYKICISVCQYFIDEAYHQNRFEKPAESHRFQGYYYY